MVWYCGDNEEDAMPTYIILSRISPQAFSDPYEFKKIAENVAAKIKSQCPGVVWVKSYSTMGQFDAIDIVEAENVEQVAKAAMIIRAYGHSTTETLPAIPWNDFLNGI
jgi:uncharacterized protein with GYD domain